MPTLSFGLPDDAFWSDKYRNLAATTEKAREMDFRGILLEGPSIVDIAKNQTLPLVGLRRATLKEAFYSRLESHAVIAAIGVEDNQVQASLAWHDKSEEPEDYTPPKGGFQQGSSINPFDLDARERLPDLPWTSGTRTFVLYLFDKESDPVTIRFRTPKGAEADKEKAGPIAGLSARPVSNSAAGHSFVKTTQSPPLPQDEGIALLVDPAEATADSRRCMLRGSFRLSVLRKENEDSHAVQGSSGAVGARSLIPISLLAIGDVVAGPYLFSLLVPVEDTGDGKTVEGYFNVNLLQMPETFGIPQRYAIRALNGQARSAPTVFTIRNSTSK